MNYAHCGLACERAKRAGGRAREECKLRCGATPKLRCRRRRREQNKQSAQIYYPNQITPNTNTTKAARMMDSNLSRSLEPGEPLEKQVNKALLSVRKFTCGPFVLLRRRRANRAQRPTNKTWPSWSARRCAVAAHLQSAHWPAMAHRRREAAAKKFSLQILFARRRPGSASSPCVQLEQASRRANSRPPAAN